MIGDDVFMKDSNPVLANSLDPFITTLLTLDCYTRVPNIVYFGNSMAIALPSRGVAITSSKVEPVIFRGLPFTKRYPQSSIVVQRMASKLPAVFLFNTPKNLPPIAEFLEPKTQFYFKMPSTLGVRVHYVAQTNLKIPQYRIKLGDVEEIYFIFIDSRKVHLSEIGYLSYLSECVPKI
jgi:hypothetical protein